jgi:predicted TIM-barrel fold metal-dependent hydrolase
MLCDSHAHLLPTPEARERMLASMDRLGIARTVVVGGGLIQPRVLARQILRGVDPRTAPTFRCDNLSVLAQCELAGGRLLPFYFANPHESPAEYREIGARFRGLKLGPAVHGIPLTAIENLSYLDAAEELGHPVYLHCLDREGFRVRDLVQVAVRFPALTFILGHGGVGELDYDGVDEIAPFANILFETSTTFRAVVLYAVEILGASRVLFGTEYPLQSARAELAKIDDLPLEPSALAQLKGGNILRVLEGRAT